MMLSEKKLELKKKVKIFSTFESFFHHTNPMLIVKCVWGPYGPLRGHKAPNFKNTYLEKYWADFDQTLGSFNT